MLRIGLTGGIGAGKSVVAARLAHLGAVIVDSDVIAREVVEPGTPGLAAVVDEFGPGVLDATGALDRPALAAVVFGDPGARSRLEAIVHPLVRGRSEELTRSAAADAIVVNDVPLLVEVGLAPTFHAVAVVTADPAVRRERLVARGLAPEAAEARIAAQTDDATRRAAADVLLDNSGTLAATHAAVDALWADRLVDFERNLRLRRPVRRPERLRLADPDPEWPARYERIAARLRHAVGDAARRLDHVGSTAVPGLPAKDVLDLQLVVDDLATADRLRDTLADAGFPAFDGEWADDPRPGAAPDAVWAKRFHGGADPGLLVHLHVRAAASPAWRAALLFRDWLRAVPGERDAYGAEKRRLAAGDPSTTDYGIGKNPWITAALDRAETWAAHTNWHPQ